MERTLIKKYKTGRHWKYLLKCNYCGNEFEISEGRYNVGRGSFCNLDCFHKYNKGERSLKWKGGSVATSKRYYSENKGKVNKTNKEWREKNKEYNRMRIKKWGQENPEKVREFAREWRKNNPEKIKGVDKRAREKCRFGVLREVIFERDNWICQICFKKFKEDKLIVHHKDNNGTNKLKAERNNDDSNLITWCKSCHSAYHASNRVKVK